MGGLGHGVCRLSFTGVGCLRSGPLGAVAFGPQAPISGLGQPGWWVGLVAGLWIGQAFGVLLLPGFGVSSSSPQVPVGTQPPYATQALKVDCSAWIKTVLGVI